MTELDNSANEFAVFSTILTAYDEEISPSRRANQSQHHRRHQNVDINGSSSGQNGKEQNSSLPPSLNTYFSASNKSITTVGLRNNSRSSRAYDPDEPLDVLREMNDMIEAAERSPSPEKHSHSYRSFEDSASRLEQNLMEKENQMKREAAEKLKRQLENEDGFSVEQLDHGDRQTILAREAEILRAEEESLRRVREGVKRESERMRLRMEDERVAYANVRTNLVSAENKRRGSVSSAAAAKHRVAPKFGVSSTIAMGKENSNANVVAAKKKSSGSSASFNPLKTLTNVASGVKNVFLSRENPKQKPKVRRCSIIAVDETNENAITPGAAIPTTPDRFKRSTMITPVESKEEYTEEDDQIDSYVQSSEEMVRGEDEVLIAKAISPTQTAYIKKPIEKNRATTTKNTNDIRKKITDAIKKQKKRVANPNVLRVVKAASTIGASFFVVSTFGSYATGARDLRDTKNTASQAKRVTLAVFTFIGSTWKSISKNLLPGVSEDVPTLTPTVVYQRTPSKVVKKKVVLRPQQLGVVPGPAREDFRRAYGRG